MPDSSGLLTQFYIRIEGADAPTALMSDIVEISIESSLHLPDVASLTIHDPLLRWIDDSRLEPGRSIQVFGKVSTRQLVFDGEIVETEPDFEIGTHRLVVRAFDRLHRLARGRHVRSFVNMTDGDIVQQIAEEVGLEVSIGPTTQVLPYVLQANQTNLSFLQMRAAALGYFLFVDGQQLHFAPPDPDGSAVEMKWGQTLVEFHPRLTTIDQVSNVTVRGWDPEQRREIVAQVRNGNGTPKIGEKRTGTDIAESGFHMQAAHLRAEGPIREQRAAERLAQALADRHTSRFIEADGLCAGNPAITAGSVLRISGIGNRFSGDYLVTSVTHLYSSDQNYTTHFSVSGQHPSTLLSLLRPEIEKQPGDTLVIGIVTDNQDDKGQGRVKVKYPWLSNEHGSDWARLVVPGGGAERGIEFLPEVNDEVLVGFEQGDVNHPYVLGGLWNGRDAPPKKSSEVVSAHKVQRRVIKSRAGHVITLDDTDGGGGITIEDRNGNKVLIDSGTNALTAEMKGNIELKASGNITLAAQGKVEIKGIGVTVDGQAANVDVKGLLINLN